MNRKKIIVIFIIGIVILVFVYFNFFKKEETPFEIIEVSRGTISQVVSETGKIKKGEEINLSFKTAGQIEKIFVKTGDKVKAGQDLAKLDASELLLQLKESQASLQVIQAEKANAELSFKNAQQNLQDTIALAEENLANVYEDAFDVLDSAYLKIYNTYETVSLIKETYFERRDQESIIIGENKNKIEKALDQTKLYIDAAKKTLKNEDINIALSNAKDAILDIKVALEVIRDTAGSDAYTGIVPSSDKVSLDTLKSDMNTIHSNIVGSQQNISTTKVNNEANINTAKSKVSEIENQLKDTQEGLYQAKIKQAEAKVSLLQNQIQESTLKSPIEGEITKINKRVGEMIQAISGESVISLLPADPFQIEVDIYEEDIVKIDIGSSVDMTIAPFPDKTFIGKVVSIDPAEKLINEVVYYETVINFEKVPENIKPGMTTDVYIEVFSKTDVLLVPEQAIVKKDSKNTIEVMIGDNFEEREIQIGFEGDNDMVEVISGLKEGEKVKVNT